MASINLQCSLKEDPVVRPSPLNFHKRHRTVLIPEEDILQQELVRFHTWTVKNKFLVNSSKCYSMQFSRSKNYDFPLSP